MPGNVFLPATASGLPKDSVVNVTALVTLDKTDLEAPTGHLPTSLMNEVAAVRISSAARCRAGGVAVAQ
jgi:mRNA interferase MazF